LSFKNLKKSIVIEPGLIATGCEGIAKPLMEAA
jgi:hypothetical protein